MRTTRGARNGLSVRRLQVFKLEKDGRGTPNLKLEPDLIKIAQGDFATLVKMKSQLGQI